MGYLLYGIKLKSITFDHEVKDSSASRTTWKLKGKRTIEPLSRAF